MVENDFMSLQAFEAEEAADPEVVAGILNGMSGVPGGSEDAGAAEGNAEVTEADSEASSESAQETDSEIGDLTAILKREKTGKVPLQALQAERAKRQEAERELARLRRDSGKAEVDIDPFLDESQESDTAKRLRELEAEIQETRRASQADMLRRVTLELEQQGYPGFGQMVPQVNEVLQRLIAADPDNRVKFDTPEGYKEIYRQIVHPQMVARFGGKPRVAPPKKSAVMSGPSRNGKTEPPSKTESYEDFYNRVRGIR